MLRNKVLVSRLAGCLLLAGSLLGQQRPEVTWSGFQYGMSPAQVRNYFRQPVHEATGVEIVQEYPYTLVANQPVLVQRIPLTPKFSFDENKRLQFIGLYAQRDDPSLNIETGRHFFEALSGKYGLPVFARDVCTTDAPQQFCRATWRDGSQRITLAFRSKGDATLSFLILAYEANPNDL